MFSTSSRLSRRSFIKWTYGAAGILALRSVSTSSAPPAVRGGIRLGGPVFEKYDGPDGWVAAVRRLGYRAAYCPVGAEASDDMVAAYAKAAQQGDVVIAEVGVWNNPLSPDEKERKAALTRCRTQLALADRIGARCCVNISGSRGANWDGPSEKNLTQETFEMIVETTRTIIDEVKPSRTYFTLETMPWAYPDSVDSYLRLIKGIDRKQFAVHFDPVNLVCSPQRYFGNGELIREFVGKLGPHIKSCHAKDIILSPRLTTHLDETRPGLGGLDYATFLRELSKLNDVPLMLEHLPNAEEYRLAAEHIRGVAGRIGVAV